MLESADPIRIAVLISGRGRGTNFQAILEACVSGKIHGAVELLVSTTSGTMAMDRARAAGVASVYLDTHTPAATDSTNLFDEQLLRLLERHGIDLVCLAGFMRKVGPRVLERYAGRIMNVHPSLIPSFAGTGMYGIHVHRAALAYGVKVSGCSVQFIDEEYDSGPIILQHAVPVEEDDTPETLAARILPHEHALYVKAIGLFATGRIQLEGRRVLITQKGTDEEMERNRASLRREPE